MTKLENLLYMLLGFQKHPGIDTTYTVTLAGSLTALPGQACFAVTIVNGTGSAVTVSCGSSTGVSFPDGAIYTFSVKDASQISVQGSGTLGYVITK